MKGFNFIIGGALLLVAIFGALFLRETAYTKALKAEKEEKQKVILEATTAKRKLEKLQTELKELKEASTYVKKMILADDAAVLVAIKDLSRLAAKNGFKNIEFSYVNPAAGKGSAAELTDPAHAFGLKKAKPVFVVANFDASYSALAAFLKSVYDKKVVFSLERLSIKRSAQIIPRQNVSLLLAVYMY